MAAVVEALDGDKRLKNRLAPVFITCDPQRDGVEEVAAYVKGNDLDLHQSST